jgi:hypothetical protein
MHATLSASSAATAKGSERVCGKGTAATFDFAASFPAALSLVPHLHARLMKNIFFRRAAKIFDIFARNIKSDSARAVHADNVACDVIHSRQSAALYVRCLFVRIRAC